MAEFLEVMRHMERMCNVTKNCIDCKLSCENTGTVHNCEYFMVHYAEKAEEIIMNWAKEHPIKTNADKFKEVFGQTHSSVMDKLYRVSFKNYDDFWNQEYKEPKGE